MMRLCFDQLPIEMLECITSFMEEREIVRMGYCSTSWFSLSCKRMLNYCDELERQLEEEPPISNRKRLFLRHRRKLPRHVTIYYPKQGLEFFTELKIKLLENYCNNEEEKVKRLIEKYLTNCDLMRLTFLQAQLKLYGMKYRELENACIYLKEFVGLLMDKRVDVYARWHKFIMNRGLNNVMNSLEYFNGRISVPIETKSLFFERFTEMIVEIWPYIKKSPYRSYLMNSHKKTLENIFCSQWKTLPPLYSEYQIIAQFNQLVYNAKDLDFALLKHFSHEIMPKANPTEFSFQNVKHFLLLVRSVTVSAKPQRPYVKTIITWIREHISDTEVSILESI